MTTWEARFSASCQQAQIGEYERKVTALIPIYMEPARRWLMQYSGCFTPADVERKARQMAEREVQHRPLRIVEITGEHWKCHTEDALRNLRETHVSEKASSGGFCSLTSFQTCNHLPAFQARVPLPYHSIHSPAGCCNSQVAG